jgi:hypothetical protein
MHERVRKTFQSALRARVEMEELATRMDARIGAARPNYLD